MKVHHHSDQFEAEGPVVLTQGTFDGVHFGHQQILRQVVKQAREVNGQSVLLTFYPHPRLVLYPKDNELKLLTDLDEKIELIEHLGIDHMIVLPFTKELSRLTPRLFVENILLDQIGMTKMIIGYDHRFGRNREGSLKDMRNLGKNKGFEVQEISAQDVDDCIVSSTTIRNALLSGEVQEAANLLGRNYSLSGIVVHGDKRGARIGYPTINVQPHSEYKLVPANGVYAVKLHYDEEEYGGMLNIGDNPTFTDKKWSIEAHIFGFGKNIYNQRVELSFIERMRDEVKFSDVEDLIKQMKADEVHARKILKEHN